MALASTQTLAEAASLLEENILRDTIDIFTPGDPVTTGINVATSLTKFASGVKALVQDTLLTNAVESLSSGIYSVKVAQSQALAAGLVVEVTACERQPELVGKKILIDKVSRNGASIITKAVGQDWQTVNQQGKENL